MKVTDLIVKCLENEGVKYIFGIVGSETVDLAESLSNSTEIQFVNVRHEQGAAFMADVYGRLSRKVGVCFSTLGPGATNLMTGIASAHLDHSPVVALIGQAGIERQHKESHQYIDISKTFEPITKYSIQIQEPSTVTTVMRKAFRLAEIDKPGAVAVTLPENFSTQILESQPLPVTPLPEIIPSPETMKEAKTLLQHCKKPFIIFGNGVVRKDATKELQTFIATLQSPAAHSFMAKGVLAKENRLNYFTFGFNEYDIVIKGIDEADLLIVIGFDFVEKLPKDWNKKKIPVLHIDTIPAEINEYYHVKAELIGNIKTILRELNQSSLPVKSWAPSGNLHEEIMETYHVNKKPNNASFSIENILHCIEELTSDDTIVISDVGAHKVAIARIFQPKLPNRLIISNGLASMGIAIPGSIGAKLACPNATVICITGDGGALMNFAEIETAKRLGITFIIIVLKDSMLKLEVQQMNKKFGESFGVTFGNPDFVKLAVSFGITGKRAGNLDEFETILKKALSSMKDIVLIEANL